MVIFTKREAYEKQIAIYLGNRDYQKAYDLSKEFVERFSEEMLSHFLLMKSAFWLKNLDEAIKEGRIAFNLSHGEDMVTCAVILSSAYYLNGNSKECYDLLNKMRSEGNPDVEKLMFVYSLAVNNEKEAMVHIDKLYKINRRLAEEFVMKFL